MQPTAGLGFKPEYFDEALARPAAGQWYEIHAENYMIDGGPRLAMIEAIRRACSVSVHGVGLSLAADADPDADHLSRLKEVVERLQPFIVSEHLAWSVWQGAYYPDLLPFPRTLAAVNRIARNIDITQTALRRRIFIENPSLYMQLPGHGMSEAEFLSQLVRRTGCGLLVDVNNAYVSARNLGFDAADYLKALPADAVGEIHLAGHAVDGAGESALLIDTHGAPVAEPVWELYADLIDHIGPRPTLIERDSELPPFAELLAERDRAERVLAANTCAPLMRSVAHV